MEDRKLEVCVLMRCSKRTGKVDTTMIGLGSGMMQMWALQNTTSSKVTFVFERESGKILFECSGTKDGFPKVQRANDKVDLGTCEDIGIALEDLHSIKDDRFDKGEE